MKFTINFGRPFLSHPHYILSLSDLCPGEENILKKKKKYNNFTHFTQ